MPKWLLGVVFAGLGGWYFWMQSKALPVTLADPIFQFEKQSLQEVIISQVDQEIHLVEQDGIWTLKQADNQASTTMVNRSKHQLHDLHARSIVDTNPQDLSVYGLGEDATQVDLKLRDGSTLSLKVGDPNPTGVSYYMMPLDGPHQNSVVTVAKASVDFFESELADFRAEHFLRFDLESVGELTITVYPILATELSNLEVREQSMVWTMRKTSYESGYVQWTGSVLGQEPIVLSKEFVRRLLGRLLALKALDYQGVLELSDAEAGLDRPRAKIVAKGTGVDFEMLVGKVVAEGQSIVQMRGETERVTTRNGFLEELSFDRDKVRQRQVLDFLSVDSQQIESMQIERNGSTSKTLRLQAEQWNLNGTLIDNSKALGLLKQLSSLRIDEFVVDPTTPLEQGATEKIDIIHPLGSVTLHIGDLVTRSVLVEDGEPPQTARYRTLLVQTEKSTESVLVSEYWWEQTQVLWDDLTTIDSETESKGE